MQPSLAVVGGCCSIARCTFDGGKDLQPKPATPPAVGGHFSVSFALNAALQSSPISHFLSQCLELYLNLFSFVMAAPWGRRSDGDEETNTGVNVRAGFYDATHTISEAR